ncbi:hypothetical protein GCM10023080_089150 [Streptomyces pseudoechinosporeus]
MWGDRKRDERLSVPTMLIDHRSTSTVGVSIRVNEVRSDVHRRGQDQPECGENLQDADRLDQPGREVLGPAHGGGADVQGDVPFVDKRTPEFTGD